MGAGLLEIGVVARELGVAPSTLRTWERRYRLVVPERGPRGERLYDSEQVLVLRGVLAQVRRGARARAAHDVAPAARPLRATRLRIGPDAEAPKHAQAAVESLLEGGEDAGGARLAFSLRLVASELVKNAVLYGSAREPIVLELKLFSDHAQIRVHNAGDRFRLKSLRTRRRDGGRGLEIVEALADGWTIETGPFGTTVSVRLAVESAA